MYEVLVFQQLYQFNFYIQGRPLGSATRPIGLKILGPIFFEKQEN